MVIGAVLVLTFFINFIGIVAISVRIVGIRTQKMAASYAVYNIVFLLARFASTLQAPLLAKTIENEIISGKEANHALFFKIYLASIFGSIFGALMIPTMQRFMYRAVEKVYAKNSLVKIIFESFRLKTAQHFFQSITLPKLDNLKKIKSIEGVSFSILVYNSIITGFLTISVLSCLYAGYLAPALRTTSLSLNGFISGISSVLFLIVVEPHLGIMADKVINKEKSDVVFRKYIVQVALARVFGVGLSIFLLVPLAQVIVFLAKHIFTQ